MVRLTDLVGPNDSRKRPGSRKRPSVTPKKTVADVEKGFLQASDLASMYDIPDQHEQGKPPVTSGEPAAEDAESYAEYQQPEPPSGGGEVSAAGQIEPRKTGEASHLKAAEQSLSGTPAYQQETEQVQPLTAPEVSQPETEPKQPLPGTPAYHQGVGKKASSSDDRRFLEETDAIHIELLDLLDDIYTQGRESKALSVERFIEPIMRLIIVCRNSNVILRKAVRLKKGGETLTTHSLNVAILSIKIGISREFSQERLFSLAVCALLGDIGMTRVDPAILNKKGKLEPEEFQEIKNHVKYSRDVALEISNKLPFLAPLVYQIHERENGNGYPEGLRGGNIHEFAKIIGMCDVYIAMTSPKSHRGDISGYETLQQMISRRGIDFNARVIKSLIDVISVFPIESLVKLNNSAIGRVIDISPVHPTRPKLNILVDSDGERLKTGKILDLEREPLLYIEDPDIEEGAIL